MALIYRWGRFRTDLVGGGRDWFFGLISIKGWMLSVLWDETDGVNWYDMIS